MKETDLVTRWRDRFKELYRGRSWFYKIPTGEYGGYRPFDTVAALIIEPGFGLDTPPVCRTLHFALEFKVERDTKLTPERLQKDYRHQWLSLLEASPFFISAFVIGNDKTKEVFYVPVESSPATLDAILRYLEPVWETKIARV